MNIYCFPSLSLQEVGEITDPGLPDPKVIILWTIILTNNFIESLKAYISFDFGYIRVVLTALGSSA